MRVQATKLLHSECYVSWFELPSLIGQEMPVNAAAPANDAPGAEDPASIKISNQHTKLGQARSEEPAPTKLNEQDNTHSAPVRALVAPTQSPCRDVLGRGVHREEPCSVPTVEGSP